MLSLPLTPAQCPARACTDPLDTRGDHLASCPHSGHLQSRGAAFERVWIRVFQEAGARVTHSCLLRDLNVPGIPPDDARRIDILARGLVGFGGLPFCADVTLRSPLDRNGVPHSGAREAEV